MKRSGASLKRGLLGKKAMNETCKLLKKSFYEDEWILTDHGAEIWRRKKDGLQIWGSNGFLFFTGYENNIHIPVYLRFIMVYHMRKGQNIIATKKHLK